MYIYNKLIPLDSLLNVYIFSFANQLINCLCRPIYTRTLFTNSYCWLDATVVTDAYCFEKLPMGGRRIVGATECPARKPMRGQIFIRTWWRFCWNAMKASIVAIAMKLPEEEAEYTLCCLLIREFGVWGLDPTKLGIEIIRIFR